MSLIDRLFAPIINRRVQEAVKALDDPRDRLIYASSPDRERASYDREDVLRQSLEAWRTNPLARRLVELMTQYAVGAGVSITSPDEPTHQFIKLFWNDPLNRMDSRICDWSDELTRSGEIFIVLSTDTAGMCYVRAIPAIDVKEIITAPNDLEQELFYTLTDGTVYPAWSKDLDPSTPCIIHAAVNRPVGSLRGESDLAPILKWLTRYSAFLEDRARLNRFRYAFLYVITMENSTPEARRLRQMEINGNPPTPGSILVKGEAETWDILSPKLDSYEAQADGLTMKKLIAAGFGIPLHYIAEPESATRTTAESAGGPTYRRFEARQEMLLNLIHDLLLAVVFRRSKYDTTVNPGADIRVKGMDLSARDNAALAVAASTVINSFILLRDRSLIDDSELLRIAYRFAGETIDIEEMLARGKNAPKPELPAAPPAAPKVTVNPDVQDVTTPDASGYWKG